MLRTFPAEYIHFAQGVCLGLVIIACVYLVSEIAVAILKEKNDD